MAEKKKELVALVSKYKKFQMYFPPGIKHNGQALKPLIFTDHMANVEKEIFDKHFKDRENRNKDFAVMGEHPSHWIPDKVVLRNVKAQAIRLGVPITDMQDMRDNILKLKTLADAFGIDMEEVKAAGEVSPYEFIQNHLAESKTIASQGENVLDQLKAEAKDLGIKIPAKADEKILEDLILAKKNEGN